MIVVVVAAVVSYTTGGGCFGLRVLKEFLEGFGSEKVETLDPGSQTQCLSQSHARYTLNKRTQLSYHSLHSWPKRMENRFERRFGSATFTPHQTNKAYTHDLRSLKT